MSGSEENYTLAAKVRGMYGRRLTAANYQDLLRKQTVSEVAAYLKQQAGYAPLLRDVNENLIHRGQLESILRRHTFDEYIRMMYYVENNDREFCSYVVMRMEISEILTCIRLIRAGQPGKYFYSLPAFFAKHASFDLYELAKAGSPADLLKTLSGTPYSGILSKFDLEAGPKTDMAAVEHAFRHYYYAKIFSSIRRIRSKAVQEQMRRAFGMEIDLANLLLIYRLKKHFGASGDVIRPLLLPYYSQVKESEINRILQESDAGSVKRDIFSTRYGRSFRKYQYEYLEKYCDQIKYDYFRKLLLNGLSSPAVLRSYMYLKNTELTNLVNIVEGIRYSLAPAEIEKLLIQTR